MEEHTSWLTKVNTVTSINAAAVDMAIFWSILFYF